MLMPELPTSLPAGRLENWSDFRVRLVWGYEGAINDPYRSNEYLPQPAVCWWMRRGKVTLRFPSRTERYQAGQVVFPCDEEGRQEFSRDSELLSLRFVAEWPTGEALFDRTKTLAVQAARVPEFTRVSQQLVRYVRRHYPGVTVTLQYMSGSPQTYFQMQGLIYRWLIAYTNVMSGLGQAVRTVVRLDDRVREAIHELERRSLNQSLRERELAAQVGLSVSQLNKVFVRELGKTPAEYWHERRIRSARLTLMNSDSSVKSIAYDLGFSSLPHFSAWVSRHLGKSPRQLRRER